MTANKNVHQRLASVMANVTYIQKERKQGMQYTITSHDAVTAKVRPALLDAGIVYYPVRCDHTHTGNRAECSMTVRFVNIDDPQDFFDVPTFGYGIDGQDKGPGKAMSYAVKYALLKALGLETGDDADHDNIPHTREDPAQVTNAIAAIESANTGKDLLSIVTVEGFNNDHPDIAAARRAKLETIVKGAQSVPAVDLILEKFAPDAGVLANVAQARKAELANADQSNADVGVE